MLLHIYLWTAARRLFYLLAGTLLLSLIVAAVLSRGMPEVIPGSGGFLKHAMLDGLFSGDSYRVAVAVLLIAFAFVLSLILVAALVHLSRDETLFKTGLGEHLKNKKWPLSYLIALAILIATFFVYAAGAVQQNRFGSSSMLDYVATFLLYGYVLFSSVGDLCFAAFVRWRDRHA